MEMGGREGFKRSGFSSAKNLSQSAGFWPTYSAIICLHRALSRSKTSTPCESMKFLAAGALFPSPTTTFLMPN